MKPYKIIKSNRLQKKIILINKLPAFKIPLVFFKNVHTPLKAKIVMAADPQQDSSCCQDP